MAAAKPADLGDFFKGKTKKKIKATNLNTATSASGAKPEAAKAKKQDAGDDDWQEEDLAIAPTMKVDSAKLQTLVQEEEEEEDVAAPVWGGVKSQKAAPTPSGGIINDRKFPSLAKSVQSTNINIDDGSDAKVNIQTAKNAFALLEDEDEGVDDKGDRRPKEIKPSMIKKKQGEKEKDVLKREVDKYVPGEPGAKEPEKKDTGAKDKKKKGKKDKADDEDEEGGDKNAEGKAAEGEDDDDVKMEADSVAAKAKYKGRKKLPRQDIPPAEAEEEKENRPPKSKKKLAVVEDW